MLRCLQVNVGDQQDVDFVTQLDGLNILTLFIKQEGGNIDRHLRVHCRRVVFHCFFFEDAKNVERSRLRTTDVPRAGTAGAGDIAGLCERRAQALARQFHQAEAADLARLNTGPIKTQGFTQAVLYFALVPCAFHIDEIDDDEAAQIAQTQLPSHFLRCFEVGLERGFFDVGAARRAT